MLLRVSGCSLLEHPEESLSFESPAPPPSSASVRILPSIRHAPHCIYMFSPEHPEPSLFHLNLHSVSASFQCRFRYPLRVPGMFGPKQSATRLESQSGPSVPFYRQPSKYTSANSAASSWPRRISTFFRSYALI